MTAQSAQGCEANWGRLSRITPLSNQATPIFKIQRSVVLDKFRELVEVAVIVCNDFQWFAPFGGWF